MRQYMTKITGITDMLHHWDNIEWSDEMKAWREDPKNKKSSVAGDDRSPAFTWIGGTYHDGQNIVVPADNVMKSLMEGAAQVVVPKGKNGKTFKCQSQSGMGFLEPSFPLLINGKAVDFKPFLAMTNELDFSKHLKAARDAGFMLFVKRVKIGMSKHIRVRSRFPNWSFSCVINVWDDQITEQALTDIVNIAGSNKGMCDWRPSSKTPGTFGRFSAEIVEVK